MGEFLKSCKRDGLGKLRIDKFLEESVAKGLGKLRIEKYKCTLNRVEVFIYFSLFYS